MPVSKRTNIMVTTMNMDAVGGVIEVVPADSSWWGDKQRGGGGLPSDLRECIPSASPYSLVPASTTYRCMVRIYLVFHNYDILSYYIFLSPCLFMCTFLPSYIYIISNHIIHISLILLSSFSQ